MMRRMNALRTSCEASGECDVNESRYYNFSRLYLLNGEHTWGGDIKSFLHDTENWTNVGVNEEVRYRTHFIDVWLRRNRTISILLRHGKNSVDGDLMLHLRLCEIIHFVSILIVN